MKIHNFEKVKGFMPKHEGEALSKWAKRFSGIGPILEIGTYCGKSALYLASGAAVNNQYVFTVDHHSGSEGASIKRRIF